MNLSHHNAAENLQTDQLIELAVRSEQYIAAISASTDPFLVDPSLWTLALNEFDLKCLSSKNLSDIVAAWAKGGSSIYGNALSTLILSEEPGVAFFLACRIREGICKQEILDVLITALTNEAFSSCAKGAIRRALASLILEQIILKEELPPAAQHLVEPLLKSHLLLAEPLHKIKKNRRTQIFLDKMEDEEALLLEAREIVSQEALFKAATQAISNVLLIADPDPQKCLRYYQRLMLLQDALMDFVKQKPEEALLLILSAHGTTADSADSLAALEPLCGYQIALWLRSGLQSEYFRIEALSALCYGYVYGLKDSPSERQLFSALIHREIEKEIVQNHLVDLFGASILERFNRDFEHFSAALPMTLVTLYGDIASLREKLPRFLQPSQERMIQDAVDTYGYYFGQSHFVTSHRIKVVEERLRKGLDEIPEAQFLQWGQGLLNKQHTVLFQKYLWCVHTLCASGIPYRKIADDCREPMIRAIVQLEEESKLVEGNVSVPRYAYLNTRKAILKKLWQLHQQASLNVAARCFIHNILRLKEDAFQSLSKKETYTFYLQAFDSGLFGDFAKIDFNEEMIAQTLRHYQEGGRKVLTSCFEHFNKLRDDLYYFTFGNFNSIVVDFRSERVFVYENIYFFQEGAIAGPNDKLYIRVHDHNKFRSASHYRPSRQVFEIESRNIIKIEGRYPHDVGEMKLGTDGQVYAWIQLEHGGSYFEVNLTTGKYR